MLDRADGILSSVTAKVVGEAAYSGDPLARRLIDEVVLALSAGAVALVNAFNPCRLIFGGGVIDGLPELVDRITEGVLSSALLTAIDRLQIVQAQLRDDAGVIGMAAYALARIRRTASSEGQRRERVRSAGEAVRTAGEAVRMASAECGVTALSLSDDRPVPRRRMSFPILGLSKAAQSLHSAKYDALPQCRIADGFRTPHPHSDTPHYRKYCYNEERKELRPLKESHMKLPTIYTIGHSTRPIAEFLELLQAQGIKLLVDVRTIPRSRHNPQYNTETLAADAEQPSHSLRSPARARRSSSREKGFHQHRMGKRVLPRIRGLHANAGIRGRAWKS